MHFKHFPRVPWNKSLYFIEIHYGMFIEKNSSFFSFLRIITFRNATNRNTYAVHININCNKYYDFFEKQFLYIKWITSSVPLDVNILIITVSYTAANKVDFIVHSVCIHTYKYIYIQILILIVHRFCLFMLRWQTRNILRIGHTPSNI